MACRLPATLHSRTRTVPRRIASASLVSLALATAIHLDFHAARPRTHHLSLGLPWHWLLALPIFGLVAWFVARTWPEQLARASFWIVGSAVFVGGVVEPAWEYFLDDAPFEWAFGRTRTVALIAFVLSGLIAYVVVLAFMRRREADPTTAA
jgi:hypothetical protein